MQRLHPIDHHHLSYVVWRTSVALAFAGCVSIGLLVASTRSANASEDSDDGNFNKIPDDLRDSHNFDVRGMDRTEFTRAFAGQLTVLPDSLSRQIVFVDPSVPEREKLIHSIGRKARVIELSAGRDGLSQIAEALAGESGVTGLHIISHGGEARIKLVGNSDVSLETLPEHLAQLDVIHRAMVPGGDILLYGCDVAKGSDGKFFVDLLAKLTGENVAASEHLTGAKSRGGDWELAYHAGTIKTQVLAPDSSENYDEVLATLTVNNNADSGAGSLRATITGAASGDTIVFAPALAGQAITLTTSDPSTVLGTSGLAISNTLTIDGAAAPGLSISGNNAQRIFVVTGAGNLTLKNLSVINGLAQGGNGGFGSGGGAGAGLGGAIFNDHATVSLVGCTLTGSSARGGNGGVCSSLGYGARPGGGGGGGLSASGADGTTINGGSGGGPNGGAGGIGGNPPMAGGNGGLGGGGGGGGYRTDGIAGVDAGNGGFGGGGGGAGYSFHVNDGNGGAGGFGGGGGMGRYGGAGGFGGGVGKSGYSGIGGGGAGMGGAIFCYGGSLNLTNCTITGNSSIAGTGTNNGQGLGGGIFIRNGNSTILNSTIDANTANDGGGGIYNLGDGATSTLLMNNTIVANSVSSAAAGKDFVGNAISLGTNTANGVGNEVMSQTGFTGTIVTAADPLVSALANNGGPTQTMALTGGSPAINVANNALAPATDQRGYLRPDTADIGAFEFNGVKPLTVTVSPPSIPGGQVGIAYSQTFSASGGLAPYTFTITAGALPAGLNLSPGGILSGTPTAAGSFSFTVTASDSTPAPAPFTGSQSYTFTVIPPAIVIAPTSLPPGTIGTAYSQTITASGGVNPFTFTVTSGSLPPGLTLSAGGILSGTPTASANFIFTFTITATDSSTGTGPFSASQSYIVTLGPVFVSPVSATPNPAFVNQSVQFGALVSGNQPISYAWNFGDGSSGTGVSVAHTYAAQGTYLATVTATDFYGMSITSSISVVIVDPNGDNDGDGFTNDVELALGTDPLSAASTPFGLPRPTSTAAVSVKKLRIQLNFFLPNVDYMTLTGSVPLPAGFKPLNQYLIFNVGHVVRAFQLDARGKAIRSTGLNGLLNDSFRISNRGRFSMKLARGAFQQALTSEPDPARDLTHIQGNSKTRTVNVTIYFNNTVFKGDVSGKYAAQKGKFGN